MKKKLYKYVPFYPNTIEEVDSMIERSLDEFKEHPSTDYTRGYTQALRFVRVLLNNTIIKKDGEQDDKDA